MRITNDYNSYTYNNVPKANGTGEVFAELLASNINSSHTGSQASEVSNQSANVAAVFEQTRSYSVELNSNTNKTNDGNINWDRAEKITRRMFDTGNKSLGIDTTRKPNEDSKGDKELTAEQKSELKEKYDVENLNPQERYDLLCDLTDMGVLSMRDILSRFVSTSPISSVVVTAKGKEGFKGYTTNIPENNILESVKSKVEIQRFEYDYMMKLSRQTDLQPWDKKNINDYFNRLPLVEYAMAANEKSADVYSQLVLEK